jgi:hypothetical protein
MHALSLARLALPLLLLGSMAHAQTVNLDADRYSAQGSLTPVLTWSTTPVASSCKATGGWTGTKFASGKETLPAITASKSYTLTCTWGGGTATFSVTAPTQNTDGSTLTDLAGYKAVYGTSSTNLNQSQSFSNPKATSLTVTGLSAGTWYFAVRAVNSKGLESANSNVAQKTITASSAAKTVYMTIASPSQSLKTVSTSVYDVVVVNGVNTLGKVVGNIALNKPCDASFNVGSRFRVTKSDVKISTTPRSTNLIAWCKWQ